jgi:hypothetical protein
VEHGVKVARDFFLGRAGAGSFGLLEKLKQFIVHVFARVNSFDAGFARLRVKNERVKDEAARRAATAPDAV